MSREKIQGQNLMLSLHVVTVLVPLSYCKEVPLTGWLINNRNLFPTALEAGSLRSGSQHGQVLARTLSWLADGLQCPCPGGDAGTAVAALHGHQGERGERCLACFQIISHNRMQIYKDLKFPHF